MLVQEKGEAMTLEELAVEGSVGKIMAETWELGQCAECGNEDTACWVAKCADCGEWLCDEHLPADCHGEDYDNTCVVPDVSPCNRSDSSS